jgi:hypothetical protein
MLCYFSVTSHFAVNSFILAALEEYFVINYVAVRHNSNLELTLTELLSSLAIIRVTGTSVLVLAHLLLEVRW